MVPGTSSRNRAVSVKPPSIAPQAHVPFSPTQGGRVLEWYARNIDQLRFYLDRFRFHLDELLQPGERGIAIYRIYGRVKTADSLTHKLVKTANGECGTDPSSPDFLVKYHAARRVLAQDQPLVANDIFTAVPDLLGIRVITLFTSDKRPIINTLLGTSRAVPLRVHTTVSGKKAIEQHMTGFEGDPKLPAEEEAVNRADTGYSAIHAVIGLEPTIVPNLDSLPAVAELQIRTLVEETWGEAGHYLAYKREARDDSHPRLLITIKRILLPLDQQLDEMCQQYRQLSLAQRWQPWIQMSQYYDLKLPPSIAATSRFHHKYDLARKSYRTLDISNALKGYEELLNNFSGYESELTREDCRRMKNELLYDIALQELYLADDDPLKHTAIRRRLDTVLKNNPGHSLALFRLAYLDEHAPSRSNTSRIETLHAAIEKTSRAIALLANGRNDIFRTNHENLSAEMLAYRGRLHFLCAEYYWQAGHMAPAKIKGKARRGGTQPPRELRTRANKAMLNAVKDTEDAIKSLGPNSPDGSVQLIVQRCLNNLCYYHVEWDALHAASIWQEALLVTAKNNPNPFVLDTLAHFIVRESQDYAAALELYDDAIKLVGLRKLNHLSHVGELVRMLEKHKAKCQSLLMKVASSDSDRE